MIEGKLTSLLQRCSSSRGAKQIQAQTITLGLHQNPYLVPKIATTSFQLGNPAVARQWFDQMLHPNAVLWNIMFKGYTQAALPMETLHLFHSMRRRDVRPNEYTFTFVLKSCAMALASSLLINSCYLGEQIHCFALTTGWFHSNHFVGTTLIGMYSASSSSALTIDSAYKVFAEMPMKNVVAWTAIVRAYVSIGDLDSARKLFDKAVDRDVVLWNAMISGYTEQGDMVAARALFAQMPDCERDEMAWNTILLGYAGKGNKEEGSDDDVLLLLLLRLRECERFFFVEMPDSKKNVFSWNGLMEVYSRHGRFSDVLSTFRRMLTSSPHDNCVVEPNDATLVAALSACSKLGALQWGKWIHLHYATAAASNTITLQLQGERLKEGKQLQLGCSVYVGNGLIDMYAKCGCIEEAVDVFGQMDGIRDLISWNTMIRGLAAHGRGREALEMFDHMIKEEEEVPDGITFLGALSACVHSVGLVERGVACFASMTRDYSIDPWIQHYGCMVDLLGRAGMLEEAIRLATKMPMRPDSFIWSSLMQAASCRLDHINAAATSSMMIWLAEVALSHLVRLDPEDVTNYVVLSNVYAAHGRWEDVARLKRVVRRMGFGKSPGWSSVEVGSQLAVFCSWDLKHARIQDICQLLEA